MRILWVSAKNFKCFDEIQVPKVGIFPEGLLFVEGENSSGKSSLFDAIFYALFYDPTTTKELGNKEDLIRSGFSETEVEVAFALENKCYIIKREHAKKKPVMASLMEIDKNKAMVGETTNPKLLSEGVVDVDKKITSLLNINKEKALNTLIVRQGSVQALAEAKGAELRDIIYELFQLDYYRDKAIENVKSKISILSEEKEKKRIIRDSEDIQEEIDSTNENIDVIKSDVSELEGEIDTLEKELEKFPELNELQNLHGLQNQLISEEKNIQRKGETLKEFSKKYDIKYPITEKEVKEKINSIEKEIEQLKKSQESKRKEINDLRKERTKLEHDLEVFSNRKKSLESIDLEEGETAYCEVCEQKIDEVKLKELLELSRKNIPTLTQGISKKNKVIQSREEESSGLDKEYQQSLQQKNQITNILGDLNELNDFEKSKEQLLKKIKDTLKPFKAENIEELAKNYKLSEFNELYTQVDQKNKEKIAKEQDRKNKLQSIKERYEQIEKLKKQIEANKKKEEEMEKIDQEIAIIQAVQKYVEGFIAEELITHRMLASIQQSTSSYIYLFTRGRYSELYLEPTRQKTLNMSIKDEELKFVKSQTLLSGGDKAAIGLGLRIGISDLLKRLRPLKSSPYQPPKMELLVLDEPLGSLDEERRSKVIEGLVAEEKFSQIFLITHTNIRRRFNAPLISVRSSPTGSIVDYYPAPTDVEEEAEE
ncbi:MAG: AAA family ATPase [Candidatus Heimdallarchaeaceae archaeon]|jgi:exonuclease SbcC